MQLTVAQILQISPSYWDAGVLKQKLTVSFKTLQHNTYILRNLQIDTGFIQYILLHFKYSFECYIWVSTFHLEKVFTLLTQEYIRLCFHFMVGFCKAVPRDKYVSSFNCPEKVMPKNYTGQSRVKYADGTFDLSNNLHQQQCDEGNDIFLLNFWVSFLLVAPSLVLKDDQNLSLDAMYSSKRGSWIFQMGFLWSVSQYRSKLSVKTVNLNEGFKNSLRANLIQNTHNFLTNPLFYLQDVYLHCVVVSPLLNKVEGEKTVKAVYTDILYLFTVTIS